ncbi:transglutaminase family protein [Thiohalocapsa marina]|uniref:transglutaminase family protein n=1 Tax=Thiohalocapsa marina TaxID=424902 RepID=UPI0036DCCB88
MHVFLPPLTHLSHWLLLIRVLEAAVDELDARIVIEGYEPPEDPRLRRRPEDQASATACPRSGSWASVGRANCAGPVAVFARGIW